MIEQRARFRRLRDRSIFVGDPDDIVPDRFGPDLPAIREWTEANFEFAGYVTGFDPAERRRPRRAARRARLPTPTSGCASSPSAGRASGDPLLRRVRRRRSRRPAAGRRAALRGGRRPAHRPDVAAPTSTGVTYRRYVPDLYRHLAACDLAVVQGGLTTCMELTANRRPFVYVPLRHHFEQKFHVAPPPRPATAPAAA